MQYRSADLFALLFSQRLGYCSLIACPMLMVDLIRLAFLPLFLTESLIPCLASGETATLISVSNSPDMPVQVPSLDSPVPFTLMANGMGLRVMDTSLLLTTFP